jgi:hypothetical protein
MRLEIYRTKKRWDGMVEIARQLVKISPENPKHWLDLAWGQRRGVDPQTAESTLREALKRFPNEALIHYNLACYSCVSGRVEEVGSGSKTFSGWTPNSGLLLWKTRI